MKDNWIDIKNYEGLYQVSNLGRVKRNNRILKQIYGGQGKYPQVVLCKNAKPKTFYIHRLVAEHFIPNPKNKYSVNHIDGNRYNNMVSNLEWATGTEQNNHAYKMKLKLPGENCNLSKLTEIEVLEIFNSSLNKKELAKTYNVSVELIYLIKRRKIWKHIL